MYGTHRHGDRHRDVRAGLVWPTATLGRGGCLVGMRRIACLTVGLLLIVLAAKTNPAAAVRSRHADKCVALHKRLIAVNTRAQVFAAPAFLGNLKVYGCATGHAPFLIGRVPECAGSSGCNAVRLETLAGSTLAYEELTTGLNEDVRFVIVRDLRSARVFHRVPSAAPKPPSAGPGDVTAMVVKASGSAAWEVEVGSAPVEYEVRAVDSTGTRRLALGLGVDPHSLALGGNTVYWSEGGKPFSAVLN